MDIIGMLLHFFLPSHLTNLFRSTVHGTSLSPGQSHNLRTVITADVDVGVRSQTDQCDNIQFELTQASMEMTVPVSRRPLTIKLVLNSH
jgi:hypothetical protein